MNTETIMRNAAIKAANEGFLVKAAEEPVMFAKGLLRHPQLLEGISTSRLKEMFEILLANGQFEALLQLSDTRRLPRRAHRALAEVLLGV